ncbi:MAG: rhomboid family intramembrane serine protease [Brumimicrobium sp.]|nr:rhomboid family intramembrane serine protease [Brumimicrobium sp.]
MHRNFKDELIYQWKTGGMHIKLIGINIIIFLFINILLVIGQLSVPRGAENPFMDFINTFFSLNGSLKGVLRQPWGLITSIFSHYGFFHLAFNMVFLYFMGKIFLTYFSGKRMLYTYILGGIAGGLLQIFAYSVFPVFEGVSSYIVGASGGLNAIFMAAAFYRPHEIIYLFGRFKIKLIALALIFILMDILQMGSGGNVAHFAHIGGAIFGVISIQHLQSKYNIVTLVENTVNRFTQLFKRKSYLKVKKGGRDSNIHSQTDEEYNLRKKQKQEEIDKILEKISKSGYESLTAKEKQILFDKSQE